MKYEKQEYQVRDSGCKKLINICFVPFSGNGINICRLWEMGQCPSKEEIESRKQTNKPNKRKDENRN